MNESKTESQNGWAQADASILLTECGVLVVGLRGLVTNCASEGISRRIRGRHEMAYSFCVQADAAVLAFGADYLRGLDPAALPVLSGALVVDPGMLAPMQEHARRMAYFGLVRKVFTSRVSAMAWATEQALLAAAQARWERAHCPVR